MSVACDADHVLTRASAAMRRGRISLTSPTTPRSAAVSMGAAAFAINCDDVLGVLHAYKVMDRQPLPIVAWLNGAAVGAGAILALLSDLRLVHDGARLSIPAAVYGYPLSDGLVRRLSYELGQPMARYVLFGGGELLANQLLALGIAQFSAQTLDEALEHALAMAQYAPGSIRELRRSLQNSRGGRLQPRQAGVRENHFTLMIRAVLVSVPEIATFRSTKGG